MDTFTVEAMIRFGWEAFKKRPWFFIGAYVLAYVASVIPAEIVGLVPVASGTAAATTMGFIGFFVAIAANTLYSMGITAFSLKAHDDASAVRLVDLWNPMHFLAFLGTSIIVFLATFVGFILLIIPGVIVALMLQFATYEVIDRGLSPADAIRESRRMTKGRLGTLLLLLLALVGINLLGLLAIGVGLLVSLPVSMLAIAHAYRTDRKSVV